MGDVDDVVDADDEAEVDAINTLHAAIKPLTEEKKKTGGDLFFYTQLSVGLFSRGRDGEKRKE